MQVADDSPPDKFLHLGGGLSVEVDSRMPAGGRVQALRHNCEDISDSATVHLATNNFVAGMLPPVQYIWARTATLLGLFCLLGRNLGVRRMFVLIQHVHTTSMHRLPLLQKSINDLVPAVPEYPAVAVVLSCANVLLRGEQVTLRLCASALFQ